MILASFGQSLDSCQSGRESRPMFMLQKSLPRILSSVSKDFFEFGQWWNELVLSGQSFGSLHPDLEGGKS
jgi:hypothetical protein